MIVIQELFPSLTMADMIKKRTKYTDLKFTKMEILNYLFQTCLALTHASERNVIHGDIKPVNILIDHNGNLKLANFGLSQLSIEDIYDASELLLYVSAEEIKAEGQSHLSDIWSLGACLHECCTRKATFSEDQSGHETH